VTQDLQKDEFEQRKRDHIDLSLNSKNEASGGSGLQNIELIHEALPDLDFSDIQTKTFSLGKLDPHPFFVSSMTAGHPGSFEINHRLASVAAHRGWVMAVGSQRKELFDNNASQEWVHLKKKIPNIRLMGNIGISQLIKTPLADIQKLVDTLEAEALFVHTNPLQEVLQPEGTPQFKGCYEALNTLCNTLDTPVILKETGCGFSKKTLSRLKESSLSGIDISGFGGTHWGRIEGGRSTKGSVFSSASLVFKDWGVSTVEALNNAIK